MKQKTILLVDDEHDLCDILLYNLRTSGFAAEVAYDGEEALKLIRERALQNKSFDLLLLDIMMPGMSGFDVARQLKGDGSTANLPIIFLTAKDTEGDKLQGFELGADDYVSKPFSVRELMARVRAVLNRSSQQHADELITFDTLVINLRQKTVLIDDELITLTKTEFELLRLLLVNRGRVLTRQQLLKQAWPAEIIVTERTVDVNITRLRKKIGRYAVNILTRQGFGYYFDKL